MVARAVAGQMVRPEEALLQLDQALADLEDMLAISKAYKQHYPQLEYLVGDMAVAEQIVFLALHHLEVSVEVAAPHLPLVHRVAQLLRVAAVLFLYNILQAVQQLPTIIVPAHLLRLHYLHVVQL
jgi:hypothetical protein